MARNAAEIQGEAMAPNPIRRSGEEKKKTLEYL